MASVSRPFGLRPAYSPSGVLRPAAYTIAANYGTSILENQPVTIAANGTIEAAAANGRSIGTFSGVEFTTPDGQLRVSNRWTAATPTAANTPIIAYVTLDPSIVYEIQADGPIAVTDIGSQANFTTIGTGSAVTGLSTMMLAAGTLTNSGNAAMRIIGISPGPDNAPGDAFTVVQVQLSQHQNVADRVAY
jgi:hypothetical protein